MRESLESAELPACAPAPEWRYIRLGILTLHTCFQLVAPFDLRDRWMRESLELAKLHDVAPC
jgi:hypothetical protein